MTQEHFPSFFNQAPTITVRDALAEFLGAAENGILTYRYADAVRLCGHSCPTVAGAYLMVIKGLEALTAQSCRNAATSKPLCRAIVTKAQPALPRPSSNSLPVPHPKPALAA